MDKVSWSPRCFIRLTSKRWASRKLRETMIFLIYFFQHDIFHDILEGRFHDGHTPPSNSLKLIEFETYYIKPNIFFLYFSQQNIQWSYNMVHSHFTLCLRARDYIKRLSQHPWYALWMRVKGPRHYKVTTLGSCVKWPLGPHYTRSRDQGPREISRSNWLRA
jgi:hypothetical protein